MAANKEIRGEDIYPQTRREADYPHVRSEDFYPQARRDFKDTIFRQLFSDRKNLLSLYNAVNGTNYTNEEDLEIVTLENAIYMNVKNDVAFVIDMRLSLYEHQSTISPNMPLRDLIYVAKELQARINPNELYRSKQERGDSSVHF